MKRIVTTVLCLLWLTLAACSTKTSSPPIVAVATDAPVVSNPIAVVPIDLPDSLVEPTDTAIPVTDTAVPPTDTPLPPTDTPEPTPAPAGDLSISAENVYIYPVDQLYTNDRVTFQVLASVPDNIDPYDVRVHIYVDTELVVNEVLGGTRNLNGDTVGLYQWAWETGSESGFYSVVVVLDPDDVLTQGDENPDNNLATMNIDVQLADVLPPALSNGTWQTHETPYANIHVVGGTAAERDIEFLKSSVDAAVLQAAEVLQVPAVVDRKLNIYFIDRVIGQGGYAGSSIVISYLDRNYSGGTLYEVLVHEAIHVLDGSFEPNDRFTFMTEGLAVWGTGGHYKPENLDQRAAGLLLDTGRYIPLAELMNNFYPAQHEVGYLQAGAFFKYLVDLYGYAAVRDFFGSLSFVADRTEAESVSAAMQRAFGTTLVQLEADWKVYLQSQARTADVALDLELTIEYYDLMREYQAAYDPTAYFLYAWLPFPDALREQGVTADLTRHPRGEVNVALEAMLASADSALRSSDFTATRTLLDSVKRVLDNDGRFIDPVSANYLQIVRKAQELGFEAQDIDIVYSGGNVPTARVVALNLETGAQQTLDLALDGAEWILSQ